MKKPYGILILAAVYLITLGVRVYWLSQKDGLHVDEGLTIAYAFYNDFIVGKNYAFGKKYTGKELKEISLVSDTSLKGALEGARKLWKDNRDPPHTNLYYTFLRFSFVGAKSSGISTIVFRGESLTSFCLPRRLFSFFC